MPQMLEESRALRHMLFVKLNAILESQKENLSASP